ncbi:MAG: hypothetical protein HWD84_09325 [Flavobacteriaceae bacterium]|nr:hypothetical protein [Flavobacteriaceae bacterium]
MDLRRSPLMLLIAIAGFIWPCLQRGSSSIAVELPAHPRITWPGIRPIDWANFTAVNRALLTTTSMNRGAPEHGIQLLR